MANWYCKIGGKTYGPYSNEVLRQMVREERLLPQDSLREGEDGEWFPAREMENLFPDSPPANRAVYRDDADAEVDEDFDEPRPRKRRRGRVGKPSNYYSVALQNLQQGGKWVTLVGATALLKAMFVVVVVAIQLGVEGAAGIAVFYAAGLVAFYMALFWAIDVLIFGIPCTALSIRLDPRRHSVLDLLGYAFLLGLVVDVLGIFVSCGTPSLAAFMPFLYPVIHNGVLAYLLFTYWGLSPGRVWTLAGVRFGYQMLFLIVLHVVRPVAR